jgi:hypothetical protein
VRAAGIVAATGNELLNVAAAGAPSCTVMI